MLGISFSILVRAAVTAKLLIVGVSFFTLSILALRVALVAKLLIFSIFDLKSSLTTSFFTTLLILLKSVGRGFNLSASNSANVLMSNLSTFDLKLDHLFKQIVLY